MRHRQTARAFLGLGSNLGERKAHIASALRRIGAMAGTDLVRVSRVRETEPVGGPVQEPFLNAVAEVSTQLSPHALLQSILGIERELGRVRDVRWGPRTIDIDILLFGDRVVRSPDLVIPHPRFSERLFVLQPLTEIAPDVRDPTSGLTVAELLARLLHAGREPERA